MLLLSAALAFSYQLALADNSSGWVVGWGYNITGAATGVASGEYSTGLVIIAGQVLSNATAVAGGIFHGLALKDDGTVVGWGFNRSGQATGFKSSNSENTNGIVTINGQVLSNIVAIAAGWTHSLALKSDGTVIAWGDSESGQTAVPNGLRDVVAIAAGREHSLALKKDGTVVGWGKVKMPTGLSNVVSIVATESRGGLGSWGIDSAVERDGTVNQWDISNGEMNALKGLSNVVAIADAGMGGLLLALKNDGSVTGCGRTTNDAPAGLSSIISVATSGERAPSLALNKNGEIVSWGRIGNQRAGVPTGLSNVVSIGAGNIFCLAITTNRAVADKFR